MTRFDTDRFSFALDSIRDSKRLSWREVAERSGVSPSTVCRIQMGKNPDVDSLARLLHWSGLDFRKFIEAGERSLPKNATPVKRK